MGSASKAQTIGYRYFVGVHMALCAGPIDFIIRILVNNTVAWEGQEGDGTQYIDQKDLFGGDSREGGIQGYFDVCLGKPAQVQNPYLVKILGALIPAFRGVCCVVLNQMYMGLNPYLKQWSFRAQRIHIRQNGLAQWYDAKAQISSYQTYINYNSSSWKYLLVAPDGSTDPSQIGYDDTNWLQGPGGFGTSPENPVGTTLPIGNAVWLRNYIAIDRNVVSALIITISHDDEAELWVNGMSVPVPSGGTTGQSVVTVPSSYFYNYAGYTLIAVRGTDRSPPYFYLGVTVQSNVYQNDMNPAHIIRECLTDPDWGMGYPEVDIDDVSFTAAADQLYSEGLGCSKLWTDESTIEDFITEICQLANASIYVDRKTGLYVLKLIRNDYVVSDLIVLDESNIDNVTDYVAPKVGSLVNQVIVTYWDAGLNQNNTVSVQDIAMLAAENTVISQSVTYDGATNITLASQLAQRDLQTLASPLISASIETNLIAAGLNIGDCFVWNWPDYQVDGVVMRVTGIGFGDSKNNAILIKCVQDVFGPLPVAPLSVPTVSFANPSTIAGVVTQSLFFEAPYLELVETVGQGTIDPILAATPEVGYASIAAIKPSTGGISATFYDNLGSGMAVVSNLDFCPNATLSNSIDQNATELVFATSSYLSEVNAGTWFQVDNEIMVFESLAADGVTATVLRGCLDTIPEPHAENAVCFFWDNFSAYDSTQLVAGETITGALCTVASQGTLPLASATVLTLSIVGRAAMPYPPGNVTIDGEAFPLYAAPDGSPIALAWAHRDRLLQTTGNIVGYTVPGNIGPEPGVTYTTAIIGENGTLLHSSVGLTGTSDTYSTELADSDLTIEDSVGSLPRYNNQITVTVASVRGSISNFQTYNQTVKRVGYGYSYGVYYGGLA